MGGGGGGDGARQAVGIGWDRLGGRCSSISTLSTPNQPTHTPQKALKSTFKVRVYAQLGGKTRSGGCGVPGARSRSGSGGSYDCCSANSHAVPVARTPQQVRCL